MNSKQKAILLYNYLIESMDSLLENLAKEQIQLNKYIQSSKPNQELINIRQARINENFDHLDTLKKILLEYPALIENIEQEAIRALKLELQKQDSLITAMGKFEIKLIDDQFALRTAYEKLRTQLQNQLKINSNDKRES